MKVVLNAVELKHAPYAMLVSSLMMVLVFKRKIILFNILLVVLMVNMPIKIINFARIVMMLAQNAMDPLFPIVVLVLVDTYYLQPIAQINARTENTNMKIIV